MRCLVHHVHPDQDRPRIACPKDASQPQVTDFQRCQRYCLRPGIPPPSRGFTTRTMRETEKSSGPRGALCWASERRKARGAALERTHLRSPAPRPPVWSCLRCSSPAAGPAAAAGPAIPNELSRARQPTPPAGRAPGLASVELTGATSRWPPGTPACWRCAQHELMAVPWRGAAVSRSWCRSQLPPGLAHTWRAGWRYRLRCGTAGRALAATERRARGGLISRPAAAAAVY